MFGAWVFVLLGVGVGVAVAMCDHEKRSEARTGLNIMLAILGLLVVCFLYLGLIIARDNVGKPLGWQEGVTALASREPIPVLEPKLRRTYEQGLQNFALDRPDVLVKFVRECVRERVTIVPPLPKNFEVEGIRIVRLTDRAVVLPADEPTGK